MDPNPTVSRSLELTPELLISQGRSLRALARSLLGDAQAAEDVEQETWLTVLARPARVHGRLSAWLSGVARHLAQRNRRGTARRRVREQRAARCERVEASQEKALLREETLRSVTQALLALAEPYRTPLILRFFEDRTPLEIARELELPASTVKSRIERGLELLRALLTAEHGGTERWTSGLVLLSGGRPSIGGLASGSAAAGPMASAIGALLMSWKTRVVVGLVIAGPLLMWSLVADEPTETLPPSERRGTAAVATGTSEEVARVSEPVETPASDREPAAVAAATHGALRDAGREKNYPYRLRGLVRDERDQPLAGANVFLAPRRFPVNQVAVTDEKGQFALAFQAHRAALPALLAVEANGLGLGLVEIELVADRDLEIEVAVRRDRPALERLVAERVWGAAGEASVELSVTRSQLIASRVLVETRASSTNQAPLERAAAHERTGGEHDGFWWPLPGGTCLRDAAGEVAQVEALLRRRIEAQVRLTVRGGDLGLELASVEMTHASTESPPGVVRGIVRNDQGAPVAGVDVGWGPVDRASTEAVQTDEQGTFELAGVRTGEEITLRAGGGDLGRASEPVLLLPGEQRIWDPLLDRGNEVRGRLLGPDGRPLAHALVELWKAGGDVTWNDASATDEDGAFAIPNVPAGSFTLLVVPDGSVGGIPARVVTRTQPNDDLGDLVLSPDELAQGTLRVKLLDADGATPRGAEVRVWHDESRRGRFAAEPDEDGVQTLTGLPPGSYRIEAGCELGWRDLGSLWLGPGETQDLGVVRFESPGVFSLDVPGGAEIGQVSRRSAVEAALGREPVESGQMILSRSHSDIDAQVLNGPAHATRHLLAPGWYRLTLGSSSARSSTVFRIWPGVTSSFAWREANGVRELVEADPLPAPALDQASCAGCHTGAGVVGGAPRNR